VKHHFIKQQILLYFFIITVPFFLALTVYQSHKFSNLQKELVRLEKVQADWVESNKHLLASIAVLSSSERIEYIAKNDLRLQRIRPEDVLQIKLAGGKGYETVR